LCCATWTLCNHLIAPAPSCAPGHLPVCNIPTSPCAMQTWPLQREHRRLVHRHAVADTNTRSTPLLQARSSHLQALPEVCAHHSLLLMLTYVWSSAYSRRQALPVVHAKALQAPPLLHPCSSSYFAFGMMHVSLATAEASGAMRRQCSFLALPACNVDMFIPLHIDYILAVPYTLCTHMACISCCV
jgi:hypothetical protein